MAACPLAAAAAAAPPRATPLSDCCETLTGVGRPLLFLRWVCCWWLATPGPAAACALGLTAAAAAAGDVAGCGMRCPQLQPPRLLLLLLQRQRQQPLQLLQPRPLAVHGGGAARSCCCCCCQAHAAPQASLTTAGDALVWRGCCCHCRSRRLLLRPVLSRCWGCLGGPPSASVPLGCGGVTCSTPQGTQQQQHITHSTQGGSGRNTAHHHVHVHQEQRFCLCVVCAWPCTCLCCMSAHPAALPAPPIHAQRPRAAHMRPITPTPTLFQTPC
jgi:hypothetical protein